MTKLKTVFAASSALMIMAAAPALAQNSYGSGTKAAKEVIQEKAKAEAMKKAKAEGKEMVDDAMMKKEGASYGSGDKAKDAMMEKDDAMMKNKTKSYGSGDKAKDAMMEKGDHMMKDKTKSYGSGDKAKAYGSGDKVEGAMMEKGDHMMKDKMTRPTQVQAPVTLNCPAGTKGQADGTCMIVDSRLYPS